MGWCLLCLEMNKDILDCIILNSKRWKELEITKTIEKHFWELHAIDPSAWICLSCWREVYAFHKFFLRIEEAHMNFGKIKVEDCAGSVECKVELGAQKLNIKDNGVPSDNKDNVAFCFMEPEILIDQTEQHFCLTEPGIFTDGSNPHEIEYADGIAMQTPLDELDLDNVPLKGAWKHFGLQNEMASKAASERSKRSKRKQISKRKVAVEGKLRKGKKVYSKVKAEAMKKNSNDSDSLNDHHNDNDVSGKRVKNSSQFVECKSRTSKENNKFITDHFNQMFCDLCQVPFEDFYAMQKHFTEMHKQRGYLVCCKRKFFDRTRLVDHLHCHINPDYFRCKECGKAMTTRVRLIKHMLHVHSTNDVAKQHCCDVCGKAFAEACVLRTHKLTHLSEEEKKFPCLDCGKNYGSSSILNQHRQAVHLKRFVKICYVCGKAINSSAEFNAHMNKHEGIPAAVIKCDICGLRMATERSLKRHKDSQHPVGGKQDHPCPLCNKISPTARALKKHINTVHEKGTDHKCNMCEKIFRRAETLREHMASHAGTPLYNCPWCPQTFYSNGNMHAHRKNKHPKEYLELKKQKYI